MQRVVVIGAGAHAREIVDIFDAVNERAPTYDVLGYVVEAGFGDLGSVVNGRPILGDLAWLRRAPADVHLICAVGDPSLRRRLVDEVGGVTDWFCNAIHPSVVRTRSVSFGRGVVVMAGCVLTNNIELGNHAHVNVACSISHDCRLEDFATLAPGVHAAGGVVFGTGCNVGTAATIVPRIRIGVQATVGAGSVVTRDVPDGAVVAGVPARARKVIPRGTVSG